MNHILLQAGLDRIPAYCPSDSGNGGTAAMIRGRPGPVLLEGLPEVLQQHSDGPLGAGRPPTLKKYWIFLLGVGKQGGKNEKQMLGRTTIFRKSLDTEKLSNSKKNSNIWRNQWASARGSKNEGPPPCATTIGVIGVCRILKNEATKIQKNIRDSPNQPSYFDAWARIYMNESKYIIFYQ